jgi:thiamine biosynthesis lipoprotein
MARVARARVLLGTLVAVDTASDSNCAATEAIAAAFAALAQIDRRLHPHSPDSDLAKINSAPLGTRVAVHPTTCRLLELAQQLNTLTDGTFDPCLPTRKGKVQDIEISSNDVACHARVALDFGGFAKGYAVDCAVEALLAHGCSSGLVNAGGDLRVFGPRTESILLRTPANNLSSIALSDAALAVSDTTSNNHPPEHQGYYTRDGDPLIRNYAAVTAKQTVIADALAKCVLLCSAEAATRALRAFDATLLAAQ